MADLKCPECGRPVVPPTFGQQRRGVGDQPEQHYGKCPECKVPLLFSLTADEEWSVAIDPTERLRRMR
jgi:hypothetical protein